MLSVVFPTLDLSDLFLLSLLSTYAVEHQHGANLAKVRG